MSVVTHVRPGPEQVVVERVIAETIVAEPPAVDLGEINPAVLAGAALLDKEVPGWVEVINLETFDISSGDACVLGQIYGGEAEAAGWDDDGYTYGRDWLAGSLDIPVERVIYDHGFSSDGTVGWVALQRDWVKVIAARQAVRP